MARSRIHRANRNPSVFSSRKTARKRASQTGGLEFEKCEDRNLLSAVPGMGGNLGQLQQQLILDHLSDQADTAYLQQGENSLELVRVENGTRNDTAVFQHMLDGLPIEGRYVSVVQASHGEILSVENRAAGYLTTQDSMSPSISSQFAQQTANHQYAGQSNFTSDASLVWFKLGHRAELAWRVQTNVPGANVNGADLDFVTIIDANSGSMLSQSQSPSVIDNLLQDDLIYPRIVINDAIGVGGSQAYGSVFDSVVHYGGGCTGTLIATNVVIGARHCGSGPGTVVDFGDNSNAPDFSVTTQSVSLPAGTGSLLDGGDVEILILDQDVTEDMAVPMRFIDRTTELVGEIASTVGFGFNGIGSTGHEFTSDGIRWGGENTIEAYGVPSSAAGANIISTDFDDGTAGSNTIGSSSPTPLEFEATTAPGDSGGPIMIRVGTEWAIAGVLSGGTDQAGFYGDISWWTGTAIYRAEIEAVGGEFVTFGEIEVTFEDDDLADGGAVEFGQTSLGTPITKSFTVTNTHPTGDLDLFEPITVPSEFTVSKSFGKTRLAPNESTTFEIRFDSNPYGTYFGEVSFESGDNDESPFNFSVTATVSPPIGEADTVLVDNRWKTVFLKNTYIDPVVVMGPATFNEADPVTVRVRNVTADSFQVRIQEWQYLDRLHATEQVSYVVMESGTHRMTDGTTIVAQNTNGVSEEFSSVSFDLPFQSLPFVLSQTTTTNGGSPVVTRIQSVNTAGFQVRVQEEQAADQTHTPETISWLAFLPSDQDLGVLQQRSAIQERSVDHNGTVLSFSDPSFTKAPVFLAGMQSFFGSNTAGIRLSSLNTSEANVFVEEEQSKNEEVGHGDETIGFLALEEGDIIGTTLIGESGTVNGVGRSWQTIQLINDYIDPVVLLSVNTFNESDPGVARARNVNSGSFQLHFEEWNYLDLDHAGETVSYFVFESGIHRLRDGTVIEARNSMVNSDFSSVTFNSFPDETPVVFSQVTSINGPATVTTRMNNISTTGFDIRVQEEEASATLRHVPERVSWLAIQPASGNVDGRAYEAKVANEGINHKGDTIFYTNLFDGIPAVIHDMQTYVGNHTAAVRQTSGTVGRLELFIEEEQSLDEETGHGKEDVGYFAMNAGLIDGYIIDLLAGSGGSGGLGGALPPGPRASNFVMNHESSSSSDDAIQQMILGRKQFDNSFNSGFDRMSDQVFSQFDETPISDLDLSLAEFNSFAGDAAFESTYSDDISLTDSVDQQADSSEPVDLSGSIEGQK